VNAESDRDEGTEEDHGSDDEGSQARTIRNSEPRRRRKFVLQLFWQRNIIVRPDVGWHRAGSRRSRFDLLDREITSAVNWLTAEESPEAAAIGLLADSYELLFDDGDA
jgi:hypothetical protein